MSYKLETSEGVVPEIALLQGSNPNALTTSSLLEFNANVQNVTFNGISSGFTVGTNTLTLGEGHWTLQAFIGLNNSNNLSNNLEYQWEVDNSAHGSKGASEISRQSGVDSANASITVDAGNTSTAKVIITAVNGTTCTVNSAHTPIVVWKAEL